MPQTLFNFLYLIKRLAWTKTTVRPFEFHHSKWHLELFFWNVWSRWAKTGIMLSSQIILSGDLNHLLLKIAYVNHVMIVKITGQFLGIFCGRFLFFTEVEETTETPIKMDSGGLKLWCINTKTCLASIETGEAPMWISTERFTSFLELDTTKSYNITNSTLKMTSFWRSFSSWNTWFSYATN